MRVTQGICEDFRYTVCFQTDLYSSLCYTSIDIQIHYSIDSVNRQLSLVLYVQMVLYQLSLTICLYTIIQNMGERQDGLTLQREVCTHAVLISIHQCIDCIYCVHSYFRSPRLQHAQKHEMFYKSIGISDIILIFIDLYFLYQFSFSFIQFKLFLPSTLSLSRFFNTDASIQLYLCTANNTYPYTCICNYWK